MYKTIQLPAEFVEQFIDPLVNDKKQGFASRAQVVTEAVRRFYNNVEPGKVIA